MERLLGFFVICLLVVAPFGCSELGSTAPGDPGSGQAAPIRPLTASEQAIVSAGNDFGFRFFVSLNTTATRQNVFVSPLSVSMALGMTLNGANGSTKDAIRSALGFGGMAQDDINRSYCSLITLLSGLDPTLQMQVANSIWYRPTLVVLDSFKAANKTFFNADVNSIDFSSPTASSVINGWVDANTNGKIKSIVPQSIPESTMMYLINAIYFKGTWARRYDPNDTRPAVFTLSDGSTSQCKMMSQIDSIGYFTANGVQVGDFPYGNGGFSMTAVLPPPGTDIDNFIANLTQQEWDGWIAGLALKRVTVFMPKFKLEYGRSLVDILSNMGMGVAFTDLADFTGIDRRGSLSITDVMHKTFVQVDEEGTEAAAVTSVTFGVTAIIGGSVTLRLDRPFIYAIRERQTGTILFIGKMADPS